MKHSYSGMLHVCIVIYYYLEVVGQGQTGNEAVARACQVVENGQSTELL